MNFGEHIQAIAQGVPLPLPLPPKPGEPQTCGSLFWEEGAKLASVFTTSWLLVSPKKTGRGRLQLWKELESGVKKA